MASLLLRDIDEELKQQIEANAAKNGRSQSAEVCAVLRELYGTKPNAFRAFYEGCQAEGGFDEFELPPRDAGRKPDVWWLNDSTVSE